MREYSRGIDLFEVVLVFKGIFYLLEFWVYLNSLGVVYNIFIYIDLNFFVINICFIFLWFEDYFIW